MLLFRSEEHVDSWCKKEDIPRGEILSLEKGWQLAHGWYQDRLNPYFQRKTVEDAQAFFDELGLTSAFWQLNG